MESRVVTRALSAATLRSDTKPEERQRAALKERLGAEARNDAFVDLTLKRAAETVVSTETITVSGAKKRKRSDAANYVQIIKKHVVYVLTK
ncbi:hypothetical protein GN958_ATG18586 [Phytophthora infestans]|uniref:Uncharacterized protein n=1 Tax=Phytophthora infestans TaxID=4787 RepID=A0A8S9TTR3_PHYIN|nr:hypothetical protein GN958_ATG18586 [Phytophthora infestans]